MSVPKSIIKINKNGVTYKSDVDKANYFIFELSRGALRDVGKLLSKGFRNSFYSHFNRISGDAGKATKYQVISGKNTKYPRLNVGLKTGKVLGFYGYFQEFGTSKIKKLGLLNKVAKENINEIINIQSKYLSGLESEAKALKMIDEDTYEGDANE